MSFDTFEYALLLPLVLLVVRWLPHRPQNVVLLAASFLFYGYWDARFLILLIGTGLLDYFIALRLEAVDLERQRKRWLFLSVFLNLFVLGVFKYFDFFARSFEEAMNGLGWEVSTTTLNVVLPVGISFYTFQTMSYTIDVYRRELRASRDPIAFMLYVAFFPQLVAGPIERAKHLLPQMQRPRAITSRGLAEGAWLILLGLFKKVALADPMGALVDPAFTSVESTPTPVLLRAVYLFTFQIYLDFSGYSDIARGSARALGFDLMVNFRQPFLADRLSDLWRRWHVSLSSWLRDYLYVSMGGGKGGSLAVARNLLVTMTLSGLWHGARWTFVVWGLAHGLLLVAERAMFGRGAKAEARVRGGLLWMRRLFVFHVLMLLFVVFRAPDLGTAGAIFQRLIDVRACFQDPGSLYLVFAYGALILLLDLLSERFQSHLWIFRWPFPVRGLIYAVMILFLLGASYGGQRPFIYFQF